MRIFNEDNFSLDEVNKIVSKILITKGFEKTSNNPEVFTKNTPGKQFKVFFNDKGILFKSNWEAYQGRKISNFLDASKLIKYSVRELSLTVDRELKFLLEGSY